METVLVEWILRNEMNSVNSAIDDEHNSLPTKTEINLRGIALSERN